nr:uncharacterized protein LOC117280130 [Nicotiana tomentosiformis]
MEKIEKMRSQRSETIPEASPNDALGVVFDLEHPGHVRGLGLGVVPTMAFKKTSRRVGSFCMSSSSASALPPQWQQEVSDMSSQLNALTILNRMNIGNIPEEFVHLFPAPPKSHNFGSGAPSPIRPRRSFDGSNRWGPSHSKAKVISMCLRKMFGCEFLWFGSQLC